MKRAVAAAMLMVLIACTPPQRPAPQDQALAALKVRLGTATELHLVEVENRSGEPVVCGMAGQAHTAPGPGLSDKAFIYRRGVLTLAEDRNGFQAMVRTECPNFTFAPNPQT